MRRKSQENNFTKNMWHLIKYKPLLFCVNLFLWTMFSIIPLISGLLIKEFFDHIEGNVAFVGIPGLVLLIFIAAFVRIVLVHLGFKTRIHHGFTISFLLRRNLLNIILKKAGAQSLNASKGAVINSFRDDVQQVESWIEWIGDMTGQIVFSVIAGIIMLSINAKITIIVSLPLIFVVAFAKNTEKIISKKREDSRRATAAVTGAIGEIFDSVLAIKVTGTETAIVKNLKKLNEKREYFMIKDALVSQIMYSIYNNAVTLGTGLILLSVGQLIKTGSFSVGDFALFVFYFSFIYDTIETFGNFLSFSQQTNISFKRLKEVAGKDTSLVKHKPIFIKEKLNESLMLDDDKKINQEFVDNDLKILEVKGLTYSYQGSENGIKNVSFTIKQGEIVVITGRTGSGKTTLLEVLMGLLPRDSGEVYWNGKQIENLSKFFIPPACAFTPQIPNLFSDTVRNNILFGVTKNSQEIETSIKLAVLEKDLGALDNGLETLIGSKGVKLSGGQIQRVAAARMFIRDAELMVMDDASSALDVETEKLLWSRLIKDKKRTFLIVSNSKFILKFADNVLVMKDGNLTFPQFVGD